MPMLLGIEIGGTKLQLGVGQGDGSPLAALSRHDVDPAAGADRILATIRTAAEPLIARHGVQRIGIGFGGPVEPDEGVVITSHQIDGWDRFPLVGWCRDAFGLPAVIANDADTAGLAEARFGAGRDSDPVLYVTVGSGIGGGLILGGRIYRGSGAGAAEIGHLRPGVNADRPEQTVESLASGWGIAAAAQAQLSDPVSHRFKTLAADGASRDPEEMRQRLIDAEEALEEYTADLLARADGRVEGVTAKIVGQAAADGNALAADILKRAWQTLGWAIAQAVTLLAPETVVIGGGVSLLGEQLLMGPLRDEIARYVFPPLIGKYRVLPAELGEEVVVHGALALAGDR